MRILTSFAGTALAAGHRISAYLCSSVSQDDEEASDDSGLRGGFATHDVGSAGPSVNSPTVNYDVFNPVPTIPESGIGTKELFSPYRPRSTIRPAICGQATAISDRDIRAGSSNTIAIGETSQSRSSNGGFVAYRPAWTFGAFGRAALVRGKKQFPSSSIVSDRLASMASTPTETTLSKQTIGIPIASKATSRWVSILNSRRIDPIYQIKDLG